MLCPVDGADLLMTERNGVEIDYCPKCRGVWLDRGELDKIIERTSQAEQQYGQRRAQAALRRGRDYDDDDDDDYVYDEYSGKRKRDPRYESEDDYRKRKRRGLLGEIFDILD